MNWLTQIDHPLKISSVFFHKKICPFFPGFDVVNSQITVHRGGLAKVSIKAFNCSIGIHQNYFLDKTIRQEMEKLCGVSQDTYAFFVRTIKFFCILLTYCLPPMFYATIFPSLFIYCPVSITCRSGFVLGSWKSIIIEFIAISQKTNYILSVS